MKQIIQNYKTGELKLKEVPFPQIKKEGVLVKTLYSVISAGTEKMKIDTARKNLLGKAKARPDLVKKVINSAKQQGIIQTFQTVKQRLDTPISLGYSCSGVVLEVGKGIEGLKVGDLVACGGEYANHAEIISVPKNLVVKVPNGVLPEHAAFSTIGAIAMQGLRQAEATLGEKIAVIGLGLIGLLLVQLLKTSGCQIIGIDIDYNKLPLGENSGCEAVIHADDDQLGKKILELTGGHGVDATIITAGGSSNRPIEQAGDITRDKGKVVILGITSMNIPREPFYMKEIDVRQSRSYGPGRYDINYEYKGLDYPYGFVRFTEQRNMACFLELVRDKKLDLNNIITHKFPLSEALRAYDLIHGKSQEIYLGILLEYDREFSEIPKRIEFKTKPLSGKIRVGMIGAGNYAQKGLLPFLASHPDVVLGSITTATGMSASNIAEKFGFQSADSDIERVISESDAVVIATRHNEHARLVMEVLKKDKPVFVEKPMVIKREEMQQILELIENGSNGTIMVGFNRRFSPAFEQVHDHFASIYGPKQIMIRVNAGPISQNHWYQDPDIGGGRLIGEACHFVDFAVALTNAKVKVVDALAIPRSNQIADIWDNFSINLCLDDGSITTIVYNSIGDTGFPKEYIEIFGGGKVGIIRDFRIVELWSYGKKKNLKSRSQDKGQRKEIESWIKAIRSGNSPISFSQILNIHLACFAAIESLKTKKFIKICD